MSKAAERTGESESGPFDTRQASTELSNDLRTGRGNEYVHREEEGVAAADGVIGLGKTYHLTPSSTPTSLRKLFEPGVVLEPLRDEAR